MLPDIPKPRSKPGQFLLGKHHRQRSLVGYSLWGLKESDTAEHTHNCFLKNHIVGPWTSAGLEEPTLQEVEDPSNSPLAPVSVFPQHLSLLHSGFCSLTFHQCLDSAAMQHFLRAKMHIWGVRAAQTSAVQSQWHIVHIFLRIYMES